MKIGFLVSTGLLCAMMTLSASLYLIGSPLMVENFHHLGYPDYFREALGVAKLLGVAALLVPGVPARVREWAYAGFTFDLVAAIVSHFASGDGLRSLAPVLLLIPLVISRELAKRLAAAAPGEPRSIAALSMAPGTQP